jgi:hypothetical protein
MVKRAGFLKIKFAPNPSFRPSKTQDQVFHHMEGYLLIDGRQKRLAAINGRLTSEVKFGGGLLAHLDKGGMFSVRLKDVGSGKWDLDSMEVEIDGKALFFKTIALKQKERCTDYQKVSDNLSLQQAAKLLQEDAGTSAESNTSIN